MKSFYESGLPGYLLLVEEESQNYQRPDFNTVLSTTLRWLIEVRLGLHFLHQRNYMDKAVYRELYEESEWLRAKMVWLRDLPGPGSA